MGRKNRQPFLVLLAAIVLAPLIVTHAAATSVEITLSRSVAPPTSPLKVVGQGFGPTETIDVFFDEIMLRTAQATQDGSFAARIRVPEEALPGDHLVVAMGESSALTAQHGFTVQTDWPMYHFSADRAGSNPYENVLSPSNVAELQVDWSVPTSDVVTKSPVVAGGTVYFTSFDGAVYALDAAAGTTRWEASVDGFATANHAVADGRLYVLADGVFAFDQRNGELVWEAHPASSGSGGVLPVGDLLYVGGGTLYALDASAGHEVWEAHTGVSVGSPPAYGHGMVFTTSSNPSSLLAFDARTGDLRWGAEIPGVSNDSSPVVGDRSVFAVATGSPDGWVSAFEAKTGKLQWRYTVTNGGFAASPVLTGGLVVASGYDADGYWLYALAADTGALVWRTALQGLVGGLDFPVEANGVVYVADYEQHLEAFDLATGESLWVYSASFMTSPTVVDGALYSGSSDMAMSAFRLPDMPRTGRGE